MTYTELKKSWETLRNALDYAVNELAEFGSLEAVEELETISQQEDKRINTDTPPRVIVDVATTYSDETAVNIFRSDEALRKYLIEILEQYDCLPECIDKLDLDDLENEFEERVQDGVIDGRLILDANLIERG